MRERERERACIVSLEQQVAEACPKAPPALCTYNIIRHKLYYIYIHIYIYIYIYIYITNR